MIKLRKKDKSYGIDLTEGSIQKVLLRFTWPFLVSGLVSALYSAVDMFVISYFTNEATISGVSNGTLLTTIIYTFIMGIGTGGTVLVGRKTGEKDNEGCARASGTFMTVGLIMAIVLTIGIYAGMNPMLRVLKTPEAAMPSAINYVKYVTIGVPFTVGYNIISAIARGLGNSTVPSVVGAIGAFLNIGLDLLFTGAMGMGEIGVAVATSISQLATFVIIGGWLLKKKFPFTFTKAHFKPHGPSLYSIFKVGVPLWLQELLVHISFMIISAIVNNMGVVASASVGIVNKMFMLCAIVPIAISNSIATISAQNLGAGKRDRALKTMRYGIIYSFIVEAIIVAWIIITPETLASMFAEGKPEVIKGTAAYLRSYSLDMLFVCGVFCMNAYLNACGKANFTMIHSIATTFVIRVPLSFLFAKIQGDVYHVLFWLGFAAPLATFGSMLMCMPYIKRLEKKEKMLEPERLP